MRVRNHANPLNFTERIDLKTLSHYFKDLTLPFDLEIGFGRGIFLREYAMRHQKRNILGVEVRRSIVEILKDRVSQLNLKNVTLLHSTGEICLEDLIPDNSLDRVFVFHPDPWFKKRHHKRRVIRPQFLNLLQKKLKHNGALYLSTDVPLLWADMQETLASDGRFELLIQDDFWEREYTSHWHNFSINDSREINYATYVKK